MRITNWRKILITSKRGRGMCIGCIWHRARTWRHSCEYYTFCIMKTRIFCDATPCRQRKIYRCFAYVHKTKESKTVEKTRTRRWKIYFCGSRGKVYQSATPLWWTQILTKEFIQDFYRNTSRKRSKLMKSSVCWDITACRLIYRFCFDKLAAPVLRTPM